MARTRALVLAAGIMAAALVMTGYASAAPDNKNIMTIGLQCDHGIGSLTTATISHNNATVLNVITPGPGSFVIHRVSIDGRLVAETPGFAGRDLVTCVPVSVNGAPIPPSDPDVVFGGVLAGPS